MDADDFVLEIVEAAQDSHRTFVIGETPFEPGLSLRELRERFGGDEGTLTHPMTGEPVPVSLAPWAGRDPDTTILRIGFVPARWATGR